MVSVPLASTKPKPTPQRVSMAEVMQKWVEQNREAFEAMKGAGQVVFSLTFDTTANDGAGAAKVRWGM